MGLDSNCNSSKIFQWYIVAVATTDGLKMLFINVIEFLSVVH